MKLIRRSERFGTGKIRQIHFKEFIVEIEDLKAFSGVIDNKYYLISHYDVYQISV